MDYQSVHYAFFHAIDAITMQSLSSTIVTPNRVFPIYFFDDNIYKNMPFVVHNGGYFTVGDKYFTKRDGLDNYEFIFTTDGCGQVEINGKLYVCNSNSAILIDCRKYHHLYTKPGETWCYKHFHFTVSESNRILVEEACSFIPKLNGAGKYVDSIKDQIINNGKNSHVLINKYVVELLTDMILNQNSSNAANLNQKLDVVTQYIQNHLSEDIKIEDLSNLLYLSPFYFSRQFKDFFGKSPYQYIIELRVNKACILLLQGSSIEYIVTACGFGSTVNFYKRFKDITGTTPAKFKKKGL